MDQIVLHLSQEEVKMVVAALNNVPVQGAQAMQKVLALLLKIQEAAAPPTAQEKKYNPGDAG